MNVEPNTRYFTKGFALTGTSATAIYAAGVGTYAEITSLTIAPAAGTTGNITVEWYDASTTTAFVLVYEVALAATANLSWQFAPLHMDPGDELRVSGESGMHCTVSMIEVGKNVGIR